MEGTGAVVCTLPPFASLPAADDEFGVSENGGGETTYKVESRSHHVHIVTQAVEEGSPSKTGHECYVILIVSVV